MHNYSIVERGSSLAEAEKAIILIHGRGAPPEDILGLADFFNTENTYIAAPQATQYVWYPLSFLAQRQQNQPWLDSALENLEKLIRTIKVHVAPENIFIMGFSQGACLTAEVTARNAEKLGGVAIFTGGLIGAEIDKSAYNGDFKGTKVYLSNGDNDPHIPIARTEETFELMQKMGADVVKEVFPGRPHTIEMKEINKVKEFFDL